MKKLFAVICLLWALVQGARGAEVLSQSQLNCISQNFRADLDLLGASSGAFCVVANGKTIYGRDFILKGDNKKIKKFPLGNTSQAMMSLMMLSMQSKGKVEGDWKVSRHCSYLSEKYKASFADFMSMRAGIDSHSDSLVPADSSAMDVLEIASQLAPTAKSGEVFSRSRLSSAVVGYALGYVFDKREKNMKKSFASASETFLFKPLNFIEPRFSSFNSPLFPATAYALCIADVSKWLECETSEKPSISTAVAISKRRESGRETEKFSQGWLASYEDGFRFFVSADYFENCANVVAVVPTENVAVAFFVSSKDSKKASKLCADSLSKFIEILTSKN